MREQTEENRMGILEGKEALSEYAAENEAEMTGADAAICAVQALIDRADNCPQSMLQIGEWYLDGRILRDETAAEAWLDRVIACGDSPEAVRAMELIGKRILHRKEIVTDEDYCRIRAEKRQEESEAEKGEFPDGPEEKKKEFPDKKFLDALEQLGAKERKDG